MMIPNSLRFMTGEHIIASRRMPNKDAPQYWSEREARGYLNRSKRDRNDIARFFRAIRNGENNFGDSPDPDKAALIHRHCVVTTGDYARLRLKNLFV